MLLKVCTNPQEQELSSLLLSLPQKSAHLQEDDGHSFLSRLTNENYNDVHLQTTGNER